ncbi:hypothetical protein NDU88_001135 [Pleurodeles waltl]|uniref:Uncharacterized protein n=1 Tax=Pleurodeles waltl TaxID=8319 RepID=A0AAV7R856_PLEWA|nr:hypothetical protein NDU88_001135 [Pleurodeles waltl]
MPLSSLKYGNVCAPWNKRSVQAVNKSPLTFKHALCGRPVFHLLRLWRSYYLQLLASKDGDEDVRLLLGGSRQEAMRRYFRKQRRVESSSSSCESVASLLPKRAAKEKEDDHLRRFIRETLMEPNVVRSQAKPVLGEMSADVSSLSEEEQTPGV